MELTKSMNISSHSLKANAKALVKLREPICNFTADVCLVANSLQKHKIKNQSGFKSFDHDDRQSKSQLQSRK